MDIDDQNGQGYLLSHDKRVAIVAEHIKQLSPAQLFAVREALISLARLAHSIPMTSQQHTTMFGVMNVLNILHPPKD
jgi:tagatose-1,6-bisphosphate aldolase non-catalytic subunit AgaZ/GatZ